MVSLKHHFLTMAYNNAWANHRLLKACRHLKQADFVATRTSFFPSIKATLNHLLTVDWFYLETLERSLKGEPANEQAFVFFNPEEPFATCADIQQEQRDVDKRLIAVCQSLNATVAEQLVKILRPDGVKAEQMSRVLAHLFQHQIHHRGRVHAMLAGTLVAPPPLDEFFMADEAALRAAEFQELGFAESAIWRSP